MSVTAPAARNTPAGLAQGRIPKDSFELLAGRELIETYRPPGGMAKAFGRRCGSSLFGGTWPDGPAVSVRLGVLDTDSGVAPQYHSFAASTASWETLPDDGLPRYDGAPPRFAHRRDLSTQANVSAAAPKQGPGVPHNWSRMSLRARREGHTPGPSPTLPGSAAQRVSRRGGVDVRAVAIAGLGAFRGAGLRFGFSLVGNDVRTLVWSSPNSSDGGAA
jgi:hypothetical protein